MGLAGFEPATSPLSGVRSNQLSYKPAVPVVGRIEHYRNCRGGVKPWKSLVLSGRVGWLGLQGWWQA